LCIERLARLAQWNWAQTRGHKPGDRLQLRALLDPLIGLNVRPDFIPFLLECGDVTAEWFPLPSPKGAHAS
jgi:hypothetical protein